MFLDVECLNTQLLFDFSKYYIYISPFKGGTLSSCIVFDKSTQKYFYAKSVVGFSESESYTEALKEKLALSIYAFFGINIPETKILRLPIVWSHSDYTNNLFGIAENRTHTYYLCSKLFKLNHLLEAELPNEEPLGAILAVSILINDIDVLGNQFKNIGYIDTENSRRWIKIDAGEAFSPIDEKNTSNKIRYCSQGTQVYFQKNQLPSKVQEEFNCVLDKILSIKSPELENLLRKNIVPQKNNNPQFDHSNRVSSFMNFLSERILSIKDKF